MQFCHRLTHIFIVYTRVVSGVNIRGYLLL